MIGSLIGCEMVVDVAPLPLTTKGGPALSLLAISQSSTLRQACPACACMPIYVCKLCLRLSTLHVALCGRSFEVRKNIQTAEAVVMIMTGDERAAALAASKEEAALQGKQRHEWTMLYM